MEPGNEPALKFYQRLGFEASPNLTKSFLHSKLSQTFRIFPQVGDEEVYKERRAVRLTKQLWLDARSKSSGPFACVLVYLSQSLDWLRAVWVSGGSRDIASSLDFLQKGLRSEKLEDISSLIQSDLIQVLDLTRIWLDWYDSSLITKKCHGEQLNTKLWQIHCFFSSKCSQPMDSLIYCTCIQSILSYVGQFIYIYIFMTEQSCR